MVAGFPLHDMFDVDAPSGVSPSPAASDVTNSNAWGRAWALTRAISPRGEVHKAAKDAYGEPVNEYTLAHGLGPVVPMTPWLVHLADMDGLYWLLNFDFDVVAGDADSVEQAQDHADALSILLGQLSIQHVVCESSSKGGRHVWVALAEGAPAQLVDAIGKAAKAILPALDRGMLSNPRRGGARPPLSPHRNGSFSRVLRGSLDSLTMPSTTIADLEAVLQALLERSPGQAPEDAVIAGEIRPVAFVGRRELSPAQERWLQVHRGGDDPSRTAWNALLVLASNGFTFDQAWAAAQSAPGLEHFRTKRAGERTERRPRSAEETRGRFEDAWEKVQKRVRVRSAAPAAEPKDVATLALQVAMAEELADRFRINPGRWGGRYGAPTRRTVLTALAYLMLRTGKTAVAASTRTLAELCNIDHSTAARALQNLKDDGFIGRVIGAEGLNAATWSLAPTRGFSTPLDPGATQPLDITPRPLVTSRELGVLYARRSVLLEQLEQFLSDLQHDVFSFRGLGQQAGQVWALMRAGGVWTVEQLARFHQVSSDRAAAILARLRRLKLARNTPEGWTAGRRDLRRSAAEKLGATGCLDERAAGHEVDRMIWQWWRAEYERMTTPPWERPKRRHITDRALRFGERQTRGGEIEWPMYPRRRDDPRALADHRRARVDVEAGLLAPSSRWRLGDYRQAA
jgi:DNA-binding IscR family transcriptional regulator